VVSVRYVQSVTSQLQVSNDKEVCDLCGRDDVGDLLDGLCRLCNPDSHEWLDEQEEQELWNT